MGGMGIHSPIHVLEDSYRTFVGENGEKCKVSLEQIDIQGLEHFAHDGGKVVVVLVGSLMCAFVIGHLLHRFRISFIPESLVVVIVGAVVGLILPTGAEGGISFSTWRLSRVSLEQESLLNEIILNTILLPIIIFEAGWSMKHRDFISQFPYILLFAVFGTLISMGVVGGLILSTSDLHGVSNPRVAFAYAALISAVDPVATLSAYAHLNVDPLLNTMVFGESVINDAVAIVLFKTLNDLPVQVFAEMSTGQVTGKIIVGMFQLLSCSVLLGLGLGAVYCVILRFTNLGQSMSLAALFIFFSSFLTYNIAESFLGQSGIIAELFCGMVVGGFGRKHLSPEGDMLTSFLLKQSANLADSLVFLFVGIAVVYVKGEGMAFGLYIMLFCLAGRLIATVPLAWLTNCCKRNVLKSRTKSHRHMLSWQHIFMMWHAGLRGGIALVLTLELGPWVNELDGKGTDSHASTKDQLRMATLIVICGFLLLFGGTTECMLGVLGIPMGENVGPMEHHEGEIHGWQKKILQCVEPIVVGKKQKRHQGGVISDMLRSQESGPDLTTMPSSHTISYAAERYELFGSTTHIFHEAASDDASSDSGSSSDGRRR